MDELFGLLALLEEIPCEDADGLSEGAHARQCATILRSERPGDPELWAAGLVHDLARAVTGTTDGNHAERSAEVVRGPLGPRVAGLVALHVDAKRYLYTTDATYRGSLSPVSDTTLTLQGGTMGPDEAAAFAAHPLRPDAVTLRRADDRAKVPGLAVPAMEMWFDLLGASRR
jgi:predicted HD phosphohydrolase